ncbi:MAG: hypothetical protein L6Q29_03735 [Candidatus Pacebacteria bacterium]|nr:hypothetical protein [Candidatus Paceibacterota bacterium]NUQ57401.1 hypothetical protein [Candidatus Paceibacter sp.]
MTQAIKNLSRTSRQDGAKPAAFKFLIAAVFVMVALYTYLLGSLVSSAVEEKKALAEIAETEKQKIELEEKYLEISGALDMDYAEELGFADKTGEMAYASRFESLASR